MFDAGNGHVELIYDGRIGVIRILRLSTVGSDVVEFISRDFSAARQSSARHSADADHCCGCHRRRCTGGNPRRPEHRLLPTAQALPQDRCDQTTGSCTGRTDHSRLSAPPCLRCVSSKPATAYPFSSASARCGDRHGDLDCVDHGSARLPAQLGGVPKPVHVRRCRSPLSRGVPWPEGFRCPGCGDGSSYRLASRDLLQCRACRRQTSVTAGTVLDRTRLPLPLWFAAAYLVTTHTPGFSALQLQRQLGLARYESAWLRQPQDLAARHPPRRRRQAPAPLRRRFVFRFNRRRTPMAAFQSLLGLTTSTPRPPTRCCMLRANG